MNGFTGYCRGCHTYHPDAGNGLCPRCGLELTVAGDIPTVELDQTVAGTPPTGPPPVLPRLEEQLVGRNLGQYAIERLVGRGGMAYVFRARHNMLLRHCAVKVLDPLVQADHARFVDMFLQEARHAAALQHPHVVTVHNIGWCDDLHFIEQEFVDGQSLQHLVAEKQRLPVARATSYLTQAASALAAAHRMQLIHRDFKPANVLIRDDGIAKLADFGLARTISTLADHEDRGPAGTPYFMAPELFRGAEGTPATDVYAAGVTYYYLLTGHYPFAADDLLKLIKMHRSADVPDPRELRADVPDAVVPIICKAMAKRPADRYATGTDLHQALQELLNELTPLEQLVAQGLQPIGLAAERKEDRFALTVQLDAGRTQTVYIEEARSEDWDTRLVKIYSVCGPVNDQYLRHALELNAQVPYGSLAIEQVAGESCFVMLRCYPRATCDPGEICHSVQDIAYWADNVELALTGQDRY